MQIPIFSGTYVDVDASIRTSYPRNLVPIPKPQGVSRGYLQPAEGLQTFAADTPGIDRGGYNWNGNLYRVLGDQLCYIDPNGNIQQIGSVGDDGLPVSMFISFTTLAIVSNLSLWYYDGSILTQMIDPNLGAVIDGIWVDGYFLLTDGNSLYVTTLDNQNAINPLAYGSAEVDPDPIVAVLKIRNETTAVGRYTIEVLQDIGGNLFPFQRIDGAEITKGAVGRKACCEYYDQVAFLGSGRNETLAVYTAANGVYQKLSTLEIETILQTYTEAELALAILEPRIDKDHGWLYLHLPDRTLVYDGTASGAIQASVWYTLDSGLGDDYSQYRSCFMVWCYNKWIFGDPTTNQLGTFSNSDGSAYGVQITWQFDTLMIYNTAMGVIIHELELISTTGRVAFESKPTISTSYSTDGETWSVDRWRPAGRQGNRVARLNWLMCGNMKNWRIQRFKGTSLAHISIMALEARIEALRN